VPRILDDEHERAATPVTPPAAAVRLSDLRCARSRARAGVSAVEVAQAHLDRIARVDDRVHAFLHVDTDGALAQARRVDAGELTGPLAGVPLALKDVLCTEGVPTTVGSRILEGWRPPYDATVTARLKDAGVVLLGKTNMDEFAMGSSTEHSAYGPSHNPWDLDRIPGGSGGGSAAAVAAYEAPLAIGTDTGGSIRQPASVTGTVGVKPTYGGVSRYGLVAFSSSLDQAGPCARTVLDAALLHAVIGGHDPRDSTSIPQPVPPVVEAARRADVKGLRVGVVRELSGEGYQPGVEARFREAVEVLEHLGAEVVEVSCPHFDYALPAYYLIAPSEASSNLARFDAVRYGLRVGDDGERSLEEVMQLTRAKGFGAEVKRRIVLGTYALSSGYYDAYYGRRRRSARSSAATSPAPSAASTSWSRPPRRRSRSRSASGWRTRWPCTSPTSPPSRATSTAAPPCRCPRACPTGLPVGLQVMAPTLRDDLLYQVGGAVEAAMHERWGGPLLDQAPELARA
jgi:aspartyl-tRNA(Asn)/glutamyl-tRNA(Gln) amidotransferase subunit A